MAYDDTKATFGTVTATEWNNFVAATSIISSGAGAPGTTPAKVGNIYIDTSGENIYISKGTASSADWVQVNN